MTPQRHIIDGDLVHFVAMTREEAKQLANAINVARTRTLGAILKFERVRVPAATKDYPLHDLRAELDTLATFAKALGEAHDISGY